jgi:hypothetical protein
MPIMSQDTLDTTEDGGFGLGRSAKSLVLMRIKKFNKAEQFLSSPPEGYFSPNNRLLKPTAASMNNGKTGPEKNNLNRAQEKEEIMRLAELSKRRSRSVAKK